MHIINLLQEEKIDDLIFFLLNRLMQRKWIVIMSYKSYKHLLFDEKLLKRDIYIYINIYIYI